MKHIPIAQIFDPNCVDYGENFEPFHVLSHGLEQVLKIIASAMLLDLSRSESIPAGTTGRVMTALDRPTPGKLLDHLIRWLAQFEPNTEAGRALDQQFGSAKTDVYDFFHKLVEFRNRWAHPKDETPAEILVMVDQLFSEIPDDMATWKLVINGHGSVSFEGHWKDPVALKPFVYNTEGRVEIFQDFDPKTRQLRFGREISDSIMGFEAWWARLRDADQALVDPLTEEIHRRASECSRTTSANPPWWIEELADQRTLAMLIQPTQFDLISTGIEEHMPQATLISLHPEDAQSIHDCLADKLALAQPPSIAELLNWPSRGKPIVIAADLQGHSSKGFLDKLYWLADMKDAGSCESLRIILCRTADELAKDADCLWDKLPEHLEDLLRAPPNSRNHQLINLIWPETRPRRFFGFF